MKTAWRLLPISLIIMALDQFSKVWASLSFTLGESWVIAPSLNFTLVHNYGAAFSFLADAGDWAGYFLPAVSLFASIFIVLWMRKTPLTERALSWGLCFILGGAVGNLIDRLVLGYVVDFIQLYWQSYYWPVFNVADSFICLGAALLIVQQLREALLKSTNAKQ